LINYYKGLSLSSSTTTTWKVQLSALRDGHFISSRQGRAPQRPRHRHRTWWRSGGWAGLELDHGRSSSWVDENPIGVVVVK